MKTLCIFATVLLIGFTQAYDSIPPGTPITQCKAQDLECPQFELVSVNSGYEVRKYPASKWVSTTLYVFDYDEATGTMFRKLFNYIDGENDQGRKIAMTAPVTTKVTPGSGPNCESTFTMSFLVPSALWDNVPKPTNRDVFLEDFPETTVYVRAFDGYANGMDFTMEAVAMAQAIGDSSAYVQGHYYNNGYDSPYKFWDRRNEVMFVAN